MNKVMKFVLAIAMVLMMSSGAMAEDFAAQGSCLIPHIKGYRATNQGFFTTLYLSNITDSPVQCKVTFFDQNGDDVSTYGEVYTVASDGVSWQFVANGDAVFEIPAHSTRYYGYTKGGINLKIIGYGEVKWKSSDTMKRKALVGAVMYSASVSGTNVLQGYGGNVFLNNGHPF